MLVTPIQTSCKVALERDLRFAELSLLEVKGVFFQNILLVAFAFGHRFVEGVFITQIALCFYYTIALYRLVPIRRISFNLRPVRALAGDSIGFSTSTLVTVARDSLTPILIARFFGLDVAGLWNFAWRIGQFLSLTFEGYLRAGVAASSRLAATPARRYPSKVSERNCPIRHAKFQSPATSSPKKRAMRIGVSESRATVTSCLLYTSDAADE